MAITIRTLASLLTHGRALMSMLDYPEASTLSNNLRVIADDPERRKDLMVAVDGVRVALRSIGDTEIQELAVTRG